MKKIFFTIIITFWYSVIFGQKTDIDLMCDSIDIVASKFLWFNCYGNPPTWMLEEPDIAEVYKEHRSWVKKYFPLILIKYNLPFHERLIIGCYLYLEGEPDTLTTLLEEAKNDEWKKYVANFYLSAFKIPLKVP